MIIQKLISNSTNSLKPQIITILDVGSSKITCISAQYIKETNSYKIIAKSALSANGIKNGNITDINLAKKAILTVVENVEQQTNILVEKIYLSLNCNKIISKYSEKEIVLKRKKVDLADINEIILAGITEIETSGLEVIHYFPLDFSIDSSSGIKEPRGLLGNKLKAKIHYVCIPSAIIDNLISCIGECNIEVDDCIYAPYAAALIVTNNDTDLTLIDIGYELTSFLIFNNGILASVGMIPLGGKIITQDLMKSLMIDEVNAERIKTMHGAATINISDNKKMIKIIINDKNKFDNYDNDFTISNGEVNEIINARIEEIFTILKTKLEPKLFQFPKSLQNITLTGGTSNLIGITQIAEKIFRTKVKKINAEQLSFLNNELFDQTYASAFGVLKYTIAKEQKTIIIDNKMPLYKQILNWFNS